MTRLELSRLVPGDRVEVDSAGRARVPCVVVGVEGDVAYLTPDDARHLSIRRPFRLVHFPRGKTT